MNLLHEFMVWLKKQAAEVSRLEKEAGSAFDADDGQSRYEVIMRKKALLLASLSEEAEPYLESLDSEFAAPVQEKLDRFSASANASLRVGSVFFMSALLFPEDHQPGQPNDLDVFVEGLENQN